LIAFRELFGADGSEARAEVFVFALRIISDIYVEVLTAEGWLGR
jgi:hypothetical protein